MKGVRAGRGGQREKGLRISTLRRGNAADFGKRADAPHAEIAYTASPLGLAHS